MRRAGQVLATLGILVLLAAVAPAGNLVTFTIGLALALAAAACASRADNQDLRYGGGARV